MNTIRKALKSDLSRIAEIEIFNYRLNFYPIFKNDEFYFGELQVTDRIKELEKQIESLFVYDDEVVKGFVQIKGSEIKKLFVEPVLQNNSIGSSLLLFAVNELSADNLWALEKNVKAIRFYARYGFYLTDEKKKEEGTSEYLVRLRKK
ncbi:MAG: GNAT family N-acetyltransferase [Clostridia bacterium]|nr:GNAT family N-acetyltransferase [Clostridia bacterium]